MPVAPIPQSALERLEELCRRHGCYLLEARLIGLPGRQRLMLYIDNETGISHRECAAISEAVLAEFAEDPFGEEFQFLEVSSPGVERPLRFPWQFPKHQGRRLRCELADHSTVEGILHEVTADGIQLQQARTVRWIPFAELVHAYVLPQW